MGKDSQSAFQFSNPAMIEVHFVIHKDFNTEDMGNELETPIHHQNMYLSSSLVKQIAGFGGDISGFVPPEIVDTVMDKFYRAYL